MKYKRVINLWTKVSRLKKKLETKLLAKDKLKYEQLLLDYELGLNE